MLQKNLTLTLIFVLAFFTAICQNGSGDATIQEQDIFSLLQDDSHGGDFDFYQDPSLHVLIDRNTRLNKKNGIIGYRIQIYSGSGSSARESSNEVKMKFIELYPEFNNNIIYFDYQAPYFKVKVGDFRNKNEAFVIFQEIKEDFPSSYIVKSKINFPELDLPDNE